MLLDRTVDLRRYPLEAPGGAAWNSLIDRVRADLAADGCSVLPDFIHPGAQEHLRDQGSSIAPHAHYDVETVNVYNTAPDPALPEDHPAHHTFPRGNAFVPRDRIPGEHLIHRLYTDPAFQRFVAACFDLTELHELADPLAGLCLNVLRPGNQHPWHFDTNEFTVSLLTHAAEEGGVFEYCPGIRTPETENLGDVAAVLEGRAGHRIRRLTLRPGDLQLFRGRYSLHRVSPVTGGTDRHTAIFAYSLRPGVIGSPERTRQLFGRLTPQHRATAVRADLLLD
ncbi:HalD/BesD family halogenase [Actinocorallia longicatena]|uniref:Fe2OG dioxygenase domain-containing protein n=1 Tax=Actinocorallia longicatena TaxID=111803 RepID=A0ABP6QDM0_9ACTN